MSKTRIGGARRDRRSAPFAWWRPPATCATVLGIAGAAAAQPSPDQVLSAGRRQHGIFDSFAAGILEREIERKEEVRILGREIDGEAWVLVPADIHLGVDNIAPLEVWTPSGSETVSYQHLHFDLTTAEIPAGDASLAQGFFYATKDWLVLHADEEEQPQEGVLVLGDYAVDLMGGAKLEGDDFRLVLAHLTQMIAHPPTVGTDETTEWEATHASYAYFGLPSYGLQTDIAFDWRDRSLGRIESGLANVELHRLGGYGFLLYEAADLIGLRQWRVGTKRLLRIFDLDAGFSKDWSRLRHISLSMRLMVDNRYKSDYRGLWRFYGAEGTRTRWDGIDGWGVRGFVRMASVRPESMRRARHDSGVGIHLVSGASAYSDLVTEIYFKVNDPSTIRAIPGTADVPKFGASVGYVWR